MSVDVGPDEFAGEELQHQRPVRRLDPGSAGGGPQGPVPGGFVAWVWEQGLVDGGIRGRIQQFGVVGEPVPFRAVSVGVHPA